MILLTLAAGRGTRTQKPEESYIPKALKIVNDKPLIYWSLSSFHALRASGLINHNKIFVVSQKSELALFDFAGLVSTFCELNDCFVSLDGITRGPAESAYMALVKLISDGKANLDEPLIINDCDHYFNGSNLVNALQKFLSNDEKDILLLTSPKDPEDLSWSFLRYKDGVLTGIVEKPKSGQLSGIDSSSGLVGVYTFKSIKLFIETFENNFRNRALSNVGEMFISNLLHALAEKSFFSRVEIHAIDKFVSLGTSKKIVEALSRGLLASGFEEAGTLMIDLDGTIFLHDHGGKLGEFRYSDNPKLIDDELPEFLRTLKNSGYSIVVTTSRKRFSLKQLQDQLRKFEIPFDEIVSGLPAGPRVILNDLKPRIPGLSMAYAINYPRDTFPLDEAKALLRDVMESRVLKEFSGESGERTFLIRNSDGTKVRKISQNSENSRNLIRYQFKWITKVSELLPNSVPEISNTNVYGKDSLLFYDMEFLEGIVPFSNFLKSKSEHLAQNELSNMVSKLNLVYKTYDVSIESDMTYMWEVFEKKAVEGLSKGLNLMKMNGVNVENCLVNGQKLSGIDEIFKTILVKERKIIRSMLKQERDCATLIHGDATLSNVMATPEGNIMFLDPIGTRVLPGFQYLNHTLGKAHPIFDYSRIRLSLEHDYEGWESIVTSIRDVNSLDVHFASSDRSRKLYDYLKLIWSKDFFPNNPAISDFVYMTTIARIFPYKAKSKHKEALLLLGILKEQFEQFCEAYL